MSLLQDVLRTQTLDSLDKALGSGRTSPDDDYELINVVSLPGSPGRSRPASRPTSRPHSPTRNGFSGLSRSSPLQIARGPTRDPLRALPTDVAQRIFSQLSIRELSRCSRVSKKWSKSQTLNYVWFQHYRKENFHDDSLPPGKWTKRESKQNWRTTYLNAIPRRSPPQSPGPRSISGYESPRSGQQTPRELREEKWRQEAEVVSRPTKVEMREAYKELNGRKARGKGKLGGMSGMRDRAGFSDPSFED
ncbi:uncharacterized protein BXZ73DRAFT_44252 [Epithele typhae]|uniref:uncharacterized protein n=1 Tax=Epithele typhae TaxID=378194 RepID=UPI002007420C|nr:uncharacterized protein BXZ73DRAFT_44252 [Epithele typhae]KAH9939010.1 hypothetical protein BXZ73DRAFT_44252 [Epithele typhae]